MKLKLARQLFSFRDLRNVILGFVVVAGGLGLSGLTLYAHQQGDLPLAATAATASLVFVLLILVFVVPPLARNAGREASQMNLPFEFTTGGAILLVLLVIVGFSAWNTGNNLLFLVLAFLLAALVVGFVAGVICLKKLDVTMRFPETIFAGEPTPILVSMKNRKRIIPAFSVVVEVRGRQRERSVAADHLDAVLPRWIARRLGAAPVVRRTLDHFVYIKGGEAIENRSDHVFPTRGRTRIRDFELSTKFPFGFFRHRKRLSAREAELVVFPALAEIPDDIAVRSVTAGERTSLKKGSGQDLLSLRAYQAQDDLRKIDWKATARSSQLTVREFASDDESRITVIVDPRVGADEIAETLREKISDEQAGGSVVVSDRFETGASLAASILTHFSSRNALIRLVIASEDGGFGTGRVHLHESLRRLAIAEPITYAKEQDELEPYIDLERIFDGTEDGHAVLLTAWDSHRVPPDILETLKIVRF